MVKIFICSQCKQEYPIEDCTTFEGRDYCPDCLRELTSVCDACGTRIWEDDAYLWMGRTLCTSCFQRRINTSKH